MSNIEFKFRKLTSQEVEDIMIRDRIAKWLEVKNNPQSDNVSFSMEFKDEETH